MSEKFKVGDIVSPSQEYSWAKDWNESEVVYLDGLIGWGRVKNKNGVEGLMNPSNGWTLVDRKEPEPPFKVGDRVRDLMWEGGRTIGTIVKDYGDGKYGVDYSPHPYGECGGEDNGLTSKLELVEPKKEEQMQEIEVGSRWVNDGDIVTVVHVSSGQAASVFYVFEDGSGTAEYTYTFLKGWKPAPQTLTRWTYVYREPSGDVLIDCETHATEEDAIEDCREFDNLLIKTIKIEYTPD